MKKAGSKKGMDIFADDDDMFSENYSQVSVTFLLYRCVKYLQPHAFCICCPWTNRREETVVSGLRTGHS